MNLKREELRKHYESCDHIWVYSKIERSNYEGRKYKYCGCMKCGLDEYFIDSHDGFNNDIVDAMIECIKNNPKYLNKGIKSEYVCDISLAMGIYNKIKESNPDIDDETARKYFEIAIDHIRNIKVSEERKKKRAKRLCLFPGFNNWEQKKSYIRIN